MTKRTGFVVATILVLTACQSNGTDGEATSASQGADGSGESATQESGSQVLGNESSSSIDDWCEQVLIVRALAMGGTTSVAEMEAANDAMMDMTPPELGISREEIEAQQRLDDQMHIVFEQTIAITGLQPGAIELTEAQVEEVAVLNAQWSALDAQDTLSIKYSNAVGRHCHE